MGHETDVTIADFVADVRAPTPSAAAAEIVVKAKDEFCARIDRLEARLRGAVHGRVAAAGAGGSAERAARVLGVPRASLHRPATAEMTHALAKRSGSGWPDAPGACSCCNASWTLSTSAAGWHRSGRNSLPATPSSRARSPTGVTRADRQLRDAAARLDSLSPLAVLGRGCMRLLEC